MKDTVTASPLALIADIGGTNARFAFVARPGDPPQPLPPLSTQDPALPTAEAALQAAISASPAPPRSAVLAVAGPIAGARAELTNANWRFDGRALRDAVGVDTGLLLNDFEALAMAAPALRPDDLDWIGTQRESDPQGPMLVLGPGTGFGAATVVRHRFGMAVLPGEAGHIGLGPVTPRDFALWPHLERVDGRVTVEALLSGPGLGRLEAGLRAMAGHMAPPRAATDITADALAGDGAAREAVILFGDLLARVAGDLALVMKATGGVLVAGGVTPRLLPLLDRDRLRKGFEDKAPMQALLRPVPFAVITTPDPALRGLAVAAADPAGWGLTHRLW